jgi:transcriptional regulator with XRE-family HTH domain
MNRQPGDQGATAHYADAVMICPREDLLWDLSPWIGEVLRGLRVGRKLTQVDVARLLADQLGDRTIDQSYVSRVERGESISVKRLSLFCWVLHAKVSDVVRTAEELEELERLPSKVQAQRVQHQIEEELHVR